MTKDLKARLATTRFDLPQPNDESLFVRSKSVGNERMTALVDVYRYRIEIKPLSQADGGGFVATVPDLPGCMSDGETPAEAATNVQDAIASWLEEARRLGRPIPSPDGNGTFIGVGAWE